MRRSASGGHQRSRKSTSRGGAEPKLEQRSTLPGALALAALRIVDAANELIYSRLDRDNTIWIQTSDNGGEPHKGASNYPLRGGKGSGWQGGFQVPCFVWLGANLRGSVKEYEGLVYVTDWVPTLVGGVAGLALADNATGRPCPTCTRAVAPRAGAGQWPLLSAPGGAPR